MVDLDDGAFFGWARYAGNAFAGEMVIPTGSFSPLDSLFVKLDRGSGFFDEAGWMEVPGAGVPSDVSMSEWVDGRRATAVR